MRKTTLPRVFLYLSVVSSQLLNAQPAREVCPRPEVGGVVAEPEDLRSRNGILEAELTANNAANPDGTIRDCYTDAAGRESPNLRVSPGDLVILHPKNALSDLKKTAAGQRPRFIR